MEEEKVEYVTSIDEKAYKSFAQRKIKEIFTPPKEFISLDIALEKLIQNQYIEKQK